jgi:hypothetical protein
VDVTGIELPISIEDQAKRDRLRRHLEKLAWLLDARYMIPGTRIRFGWDGILGLVPVLGDVIMAFIAIHIVIQGARLRPGRAVILQMIGNVLLDFILGQIPVAGDIGDVFFKANIRNLRLLGIKPELRGPQ